MSDIIFSSQEHRQFYVEMLHNVGKMDSYHKAFFYVLGIASGTRSNINSLYNCSEDCIEPSGLYASWQTGCTYLASLLAFNLWNGYTEKENCTPDDLFACEFAPFFFEGIRLRYPEYCKNIRR